MLKISDLKTMKTFLIVLLGQLFSNFGTSLLRFGFNVWLYVETESIIWFSSGMLLGFLPSVLFGPLAGVVADRYDRRKIMIVSDTLAALTTVALGLLYWNAHLTAWHIMVFQFLNASFTAFQSPAFTAAKTQLVEPKHLGNANGMSHFQHALVSLVAPMVAGFALFAMDKNMTVFFIADFSTYLIAVLTLAVVKFPGLDRGQAKRPTDLSLTAIQSFTQDLVAGWKYLKERRGLLSFLLYITFMGFVAGFINPLLTPMILDLGTEKEMGYIWSLAGAGVLLGSFVMSAWGGSLKRRVHVVFGTLILTGLASFLVVFPSLWLIGIGLFIASVLNPILNTAFTSLFQMKISPEYQGRVFALDEAMYSAGSVISLAISGPLAEWVFNPLLAENGLLAESVGSVVGIGPNRGIALIIAISASMLIISTISAYLKPHIRNLEREIPDAHVGA